VTISAVGATFNLPLLCNASKFTIGQWIQFSTFGRYPIVGINSVTNLLTLRNSCADGTTAIAGNPDPGTQICGVNNIWVTGSDPCLDAEAFCDGVKECFEAISDDNPLCTPDFPLTTDAECVFLMGLTSACDAGDCPQPDDPNCWKKLPWIRFCKNTVCFVDGLQMAGEDETVRSVGITEEGCLRQSLGGAFVSLRVKLLEKAGSNVSAELNDNVDLEDFGVPTGATAAAIRAYYVFQNDGDEDQGLSFATYLRGAAEAINSPNTNVLTISMVNTDGRDNIPAPFYATVPLTPTDKTIYHEYQDLGSSGSNFATMVLFIDGYYA